MKYDLDLIRKTAVLLLCVLLLAGCGGQPAADPAAGDHSSAPAGTRPSFAETAEAAPFVPKAKAADLMEDLTPQPVEGKEADAAFKEALCRLSAGLFIRLYDGAKDKNLLISPLSVLTALTMTGNGAAGKTLAEMEQVLCGGAFSMEEMDAYLHSFLNRLPSEAGSRFCFADSIWFRDAEGFTVRKDFLQKNVDYLGADVYKAPFDAGTLRDINQWVELKTEGMIPKILEELYESDRMVLVNALVFDALWEHELTDPAGDPDAKPGSFTERDGNVREAYLLRGEEETYLEDGSCTGFMKAYRGDRYRFAALLPKEGTDIDSFVSSLSGEKLAALLAGEQKVKTFISLPAFSGDSDLLLNDALIGLGMRLAFTGEGGFPDGGFGGISADEPLCISRVLHRTHIELNSAGTKAAAATAVVMRKNAAVMEDTKTVCLDRPFVYFIIDTETRLPLFMGTLTHLPEKP